MEKIVSSMQPWFDAVVKSSAQATLLVLLVVVVQACFRHKLPPPWRHALWFLVVARLMLPVSFESAVSLFNYVRVPQWPAQKIQFASNLPTLHEVPAAQPAASLAQADGVAPSGPSSSEPAVVATTQAASPALSAAASLGWQQQASGAMRALLDIAIVAWMFGAVMLFARLVWNAWSWHAKLSRSKPCLNEALLEVLREARERSGFGTRIRLVETGALESPALYGFFRPILLIPTGIADKFSPAELRLIFLHELAHHKRADIAVNWIVTVLQIVHWFNPLLWWGFARMRADREVACDYLALKRSSSEEARVYGQTLLKLLENIGASPVTPGALGIVEHKEQIKNRLAMILGFKRRQKLPVLLVGVLVLLAVAALTDAQQGKPAAREPLLKLHFRGLKAMASDTNLAIFREVHGLSETQTLKSETAGRLAGYFANQWTDSADAKRALRKFLAPVLADALDEESHLEIRRTAAGGAEWILAARLPADRADLWEKSFQAVNGSNQTAVLEIKLGKLQGRVIPELISKKPLTLARAGDWMVVGGGMRLATNSTLVADLANLGQPKTSTNQAWLEGGLDAANFGPWTAWARKLKIARTHFTIATRRDALRTEATFTMNGKSGWTFQPWQIPSSLMRDPLVGFTAMQGLAPLFAETDLVKKLRLEEVPNQLFLWAQPTAFATAFGAMPMNNPSNAVMKLAQNGLPLLKDLLGTNLVGQFVVATNIPSLAWKDLPVAVPFVRAERPNFLHFGLIPLYDSTNLPPAELLEQVTSRTNLVYYDWEVTSPRLKNWPATSQFASLAASLYLNPRPTAVDLWVDAIHPKLTGNAITEVVAAGPSEWKLSRRSDIGFTSAEIGFFMRWFNSSIFPRVGFETWVDPELKKMPRLQKRPTAEE